MALDPKLDPGYITAHPYRHISASEYDMGANYRIVREKGLDDHLVLFTVSGCGAANGTELPAGALYLFQPHQPHDYGTATSAGRWHFLWAHIHAPAAWMPMLDFQAISLDEMPQEERLRLVGIFREAVSCASSGGGWDEALAMNLMENFFLRIARFRHAEGDFTFVEKVRSHILRHIDGDLRVGTLAERFGLSSSRFAHRFRDAFGLSPQAFVENCRMETARRLLLATPKSVKEIALSCGFKDPLYFTKRFTHATGRPPTAWR